MRCSISHSPAMAAAICQEATKVRKVSGQKNGSFRTLLGQVKDPVEKPVRIVLIAQTFQALPAGLGV
jgi:hypothetical protein